MKDLDEKRKLLENSRLFKGFSPAVIESIAPLLHPCQFKKDNLVCLKGDESDSLYIIREGEVEVSVTSQQGKIILLGLLSSGDVFGEIGLLDKKSRTADVTARSDVTLYKLSSSDFERISKSFGTAEFSALTSYICYLFRKVTNNLEEAIFLDASIRVAKKIGELYEKSEGARNNSFEITMSQEDLGKLAGLSREATNKSLSRLEEAGLIEKQYKKIFIPDIHKFQKILNSN